MPTFEEQRSHAIQAAAQRYRGLQLDPRTYQDLCERISYGDAKLVLCQEPGREVWEVKHNGVRMHAVYDTRRRNIVTFLRCGGHIVPGQKTGRDAR